MEDSELIEELKRQNKITDYDIEMAQASLLGLGESAIIDTIHLTYCKLNHDNECDYYEDEGWSKLLWNELLPIIRTKSNEIKFKILAKNSCQPPLD